MGEKEITELLFYLVPAVLVFVTSFFLIKRFLDNQHKIKLIEARMASSRELLPLKLQAYERLVLFLERISPNNLLGRVYTKGMTVQDFHLELLNTIKQEFEHNITQQIYVSPQAWHVIRKAREEVAALINTCAATLDREDKGAMLNKKIFEQVMNEERLPTQQAIDFLKEEVSRYY